MDECVVTPSWACVKWVASPPQSGLGQLAAFTSSPWARDGVCAGRIWGPGEGRLGMFSAICYAPSDGESGLFYTRAEAMAFVEERWAAYARQRATEDLLDHTTRSLGRVP